MNTVIVVFAYNRPRHLSKSLFALSQNHLASSLPCRIYIDGPKASKDHEAISNVITIAESIDGFSSVEIIVRDKNLGLYTSLTSGITESLEKYESVLVFEDDILTSRYAIKFLLDGLELYSGEFKVASIHAYTPPISKPLPETFFLRGADCWGWATWRDQWKYYRHDAEKMAREIKERGLVNLFNLNGNYPYYKMLRDKAKGKNNSWAICWHASCFLAEKLTLYPGFSLVKNIGLDFSGENCGPSEISDSERSSTQIQASPIKIEVNPYISKVYSQHFHINKVNHLFSMLRLRNFISCFCNLIRPSKLHLEGNYQTFRAARSACSGYSDSLILHKVTNAITSVINGEGSYERDGTVFQSTPENLRIRKVLASILSKDDSVIDFGGGLGGTYINNRDIMPVNIRYTVIEQAIFVARGRDIARQNGLSIDFEESMQFLPSMPRLVILSSVLQYIENPYDVISLVVSLCPEYILIDRTPFSKRPVWRLQDNGNYYGSNVKYPHRPLGYNDLLSSLRGYSLVQKWSNSFDPKLPRHHGLLLVKNH